MKLRTPRQGMVPAGAGDRPDLLSYQAERLSWLCSDGDGAPGAGPGGVLRAVRLWEGASAKERQWALEAGKGRESDAPLESPEGTPPSW